MILPEISSPQQLIALKQSTAQTKSAVLCRENQDR
jgi:hypothetical protein